MKPLSKRVIERAVAAIGGLNGYHHQCHAASLDMIRTGLLPKGARIARGTCRDVGGQHSWIVLGNPYDPDVRVLDPTLWSYTDAAPYVWQGLAPKGEYRPKGSGSIWAYGRPAPPTGPVIELNVKWSMRAREFMRLAAPKGLDRQGWYVLANAPVDGWPAAEILGAMSDDNRVSALVPIDVLGMVTDRNPCNLYW